MIAHRAPECESVGQILRICPSRRTAAAAAPLAAAAGPAVRTDAATEPLHGAVRLSGRSCGLLRPEPVDGRTAAEPVPVLSGGRLGLRPKLGPVDGSEARRRSVERRVVHDAVRPVHRHRMPTGRTFTHARHRPVSAASLAGSRRRRSHRRRRAPSRLRTTSTASRSPFDQRSPSAAPEREGEASRFPLCDPVPSTLTGPVRAGGPDRSSDRETTRQRCRAPPSRGLPSRLAGPATRRLAPPPSPLA